MIISAELQQTIRAVQVGKDAALLRPSADYLLFDHSCNLGSGDLKKLGVKAQALLVQEA